MLDHAGNVWSSHGPAEAIVPDVLDDGDSEI